MEKTQNLSVGKNKPLKNNNMKQTYWVKAEKEWVDVDKTEFINIEEDFHGHDLMTFEYGGVEYQSNVVRGSQPG